MYTLSFASIFAITKDKSNIALKFQQAYFACLGRDCPIQSTGSVQYQILKLHEHLGIVTLGYSAML